MIIAVSSVRLCSPGGKILLGSLLGKKLYRKQCIRVKTDSNYQVVD